MRREPIIDYFAFGTGFRYLLDSITDHPIRGHGYIEYNIDRFLAELPELGLAVTDRAATPLRTFRKKVLELPSDARLTVELGRELKKIMTELRPTLIAELKGVHAFVVTPKTIDVERLLSDVPSLLGPGTYVSLPEIAKNDFSEAGKAIAFERPTAAAFHLLRGTESVLRYFYTEQVKQRRVKPLMWGPVVLDLRQRRKTAMHTTLYNNLDNIRTSFRNPTQHPELIYNIHEAQDLWSLCVEAVNRMIRVLVKDVAGAPPN